MTKLSLILTLLLGWFTAAAQFPGMPSVTLPQLPQPPQPALPTPNVRIGSPPIVAPMVPNYGQDAARQRLQQQNAEIDRDYYENEARRQHRTELEHDIHEFETSRLARDAYFKASRTRYWQALAELRAMLEGRAPKSVMRAVWLVENTHFDGTIPYEKFAGKIKWLAAGCRALVLEAGGSPTNPADNFWALHRVMTDTVQVRLPNGQLFQHLPFTYDFEDFWARNDRRKYLVTKLLQTNSGQCHSMPLLYRMVAEELGIKSYLSFAPNHVFIRVKSPDNQMYYYETTNGHFVTEGWLLGSGYIKPAAIKSRMYLDTVTLTQTIAYCVTDLANNFEFRHGYDDFIDVCAALSLQYYPHGHSSIAIANNAAAFCFGEALQAAGNPTPAQLVQFPEAARRAVIAREWS